MSRLTLATALALAVAACAGAAERARGPSDPVAKPTAARAPTSNVLFADYAGTAKCASCHPSHVENWLRSPMHNMTRVPETLVAADVKGPFDGSVFHFKNDSARLETFGKSRFVSISSKRFGDNVYKVTRIIGGHHREDYAGVPVDSAREDARVLGDPTEELVLPVTFVYATKSLRLKGYSVMVKERPGLRAGPIWNETCIFCHNTPPHFDTLFGALAGPGAPAYQGEVLDPLLPPQKRAKYVVTNDDALGKALGVELARIGAKRKQTTLRDAIGATRQRFRANHLVEVGIGCESCHLGSAEHVRDPNVRPSFEPKSSFFEVRLPEGPSTRAARINRVCARCHQVLFSGYEPTWEGGSRRHPNTSGGSNINSGEARDMMLGACATKMTCVDCHDPHAVNGTSVLRALDAKKEDALCTKCHEKLAGDDALRAHSHHDPGGAGARCISCHMPKKNMSLDGTLSRYHRIGSPTDPQRVLLDRPLECALCHADKTVEALVSKMETWWNKRFDRAGLEKQYGALDANVLLATAERGKPHEQAVAFQILGDVRDRAAIPVLMTSLIHPYPIVRGYAKRALDTIHGAPIPVDIDADESEIMAATKAWVMSRPPP